MIINHSQKTHSLEWIYDQNGTVRVYARTVTYSEPGRLYKIVYTPSGYAALPFDEPVGAFFVGSPKNAIPDLQFGFFVLGGLIDGVLLSQDAQDAKTVEAVDGTIRYSSSPTITRYGFGFIESIDERGYASVYLVPREIYHDVE